MGDLDFRELRQAQPCQRLFSVPAANAFVLEPGSPGIVGQLMPVRTPSTESIGSSIQEAEERFLGVSSDIRKRSGQMPDSVRHVHTGQLIPKATLKMKASKYQVYLERAYNLLNAGKQDSSIQAYETMGTVMTKAWNAPRIGTELAYSLCDYIRECGYLQHLLQYFVQPSLDDSQRFAIGSALQEMMSKDNRDFIVSQHFLEPLVETIKSCVKKLESMKSQCKLKKERLRVVMSITEALFKHSAETSLKLIDLGVLDIVLGTIRKANGGTEVLRHAALALVNLAMYSDNECEKKIIRNNVPNWLFLLASHQDDVTCYYACLAICVLSSKKEIEGVVTKSGTLNLVGPFLANHKPQLFVQDHYKLSQGRPKDWLRRLVHMLQANRTEAKGLAAFHFCMEAVVKKNQERLHVLHEIGAVKALKEVASSPDELATKFATIALKTIGEELPHRLCQKVPLWNVNDVQYWVAKIGFESFAKRFGDQMVDGDLLLLITEEELDRDIKMDSGLLRKRFMRELESLKVSTDYSSVDQTNLDGFLQSVCPDLSFYTYRLLDLGFDRTLIFNLTEDMMETTCGIKNPVHRMKLGQALRECEGKGGDDVDVAILSKQIDIFISYRRSTGCQLASLLKVMLQLRGYKVFLDVDRLSAGKFDSSLLKNIQAASHFILILSEYSLDRLMDDDACADWVHKEILCAMRHSKNIVPVLDGNFRFPDSNRIPQDIRSITRFNGIKWVHEYQDACIDKLERFITGEVETSDSVPLQEAPLPNRQLSAPGDAALYRSSSVPAFEMGDEKQKRHNTVLYNQGRKNSSASLCETLKVESLRSKIKSL